MAIWNRYRPGATESIAVVVHCAVLADSRTQGTTIPGGKSSTPNLPVITPVSKKDPDTVNKVRPEFGPTPGESDPGDRVVVG